tara:strand:+ start:154 stop:1473 length:1320 start_codon:yes stop_codon:yes gene_type:complete
MPNYNRIKAAKAHPIGTIMPWTGSTSESALSPDAIPKGWIVCNGNQLKAKDYPLLAQILGNLYGPVVEPGQPFVGISNSYPSYQDDDVFNLPTLNQQALIDLESNLLTSQELAVIGTYVSLNGYDSQNQPVANVLSYIDAQFTAQNESELSGKIKGITLDDPSYFDTIRTIPRKLGVEHTASHTHPRPTGSFYPSVELGGGYLGLFEPGFFETASSEYTTGGDTGLTSQEPLADRFNPGTVTWTAYDPSADSLVNCDSFRHFGQASDVLPVFPQSGPRTVASYGQTGLATNGYQDDNSCIQPVQQPAVTAPFPPPGTYLGQRNYYVSDQVPEARRSDFSTPPTTDPSDYYGAVGAGRDFPYPTTLNHGGDAFTASSLGSHNHFTIDISMTKGQMNLPSTILINNMTTGNLEPLDVDRALSVQVNPNTPSLVVLYIIRAY